ncbi:glycoside hydrolase 43 family protein [Pelomonas cellulosilytica]|uniref:Glycoside hydrolase 43 family protein n=1 Tax=Pelomonas cellulosilytica TaxID=2906762 RepID=A0ABS8XXI1_9BURK|nr:glycoside hydrolase 43 family protein [Pelomonas sp. P8]MCE4556522.1 glycoside hydrolase 43 family protein [Pelomonas sp. P8]
MTTRLQRVARAFATMLVGSLLGAAAPAWQSDNGDGTYSNPPLWADYPDPDVIRVGEDFYFATTTFANSPGLRILHSRDLVNWTIAGHVFPRLTGSPAFDLQGRGVYRRGIYAPSLRHHDGAFYLAVTPVGLHTRLCRAVQVQGPWDCHELDREAFDPALFFDTDGQAYIATSVSSDGTITLLTLSADLRQVTDARKIHYIRGAEGSKLIKRDGTYYLFNAIPRRLGMSISRARSLQGPWETIDSINTAQTGGHQGAIVDLADGRWWGFVMQDQPTIGRITNFSPIFWKDGWPVWGTPEAPGRVPARATKPVQGQPPAQPATSDEFSEPVLGLQWAWNHNPDDAMWSLRERPGHLRLHAGPAADYWHARNTLTQKGQGPFSRNEVSLDFSHLAAGDQCGLGTLGKVNGQLAATRGPDGLSLQWRRIVDQGDGVPQTTEEGPRIALTGPRAELRLEMNFVRKQASLSWRPPEGAWQRLGDAFELVYDWRTGTFQGPQVALFCFHAGSGAGGYMDVDWFHFSDLPVALPPGSASAP